MKKVFLVLVLFTIGFFSVFAQQNPSITIVNNTGNAIDAFYIRQTGTDSWVKHTFANNQTVSNGQSFSLQLPNPINAVNQYDIRLERPNNLGTYTKNAVTVSADSRIEFTSSDSDSAKRKFNSLEDLC
jgi:beta-galactosidase GanA